MLSRDFVDRTSLISVIIPRAFIAVRRNIPDPLEPLSEFRVVKRHPSMEADASDTVPDVLRH